MCSFFFFFLELDNTAGGRIRRLGRFVAPLKIGGCLLTYVKLQGDPGLRRIIVKTSEVCIIIAREDIDIGE